MADDASLAAAPAEPTASESPVIVDHYEDVAEAYEQAWFYESGSPYQAWVVSRVAEELDLTAESRLVDLGAGTGNFSVALHDAVRLRTPVLCVDPSAAMLAVADKDPRLTTLVGTAMDVVASDVSFDRVLLKEVFHHIPEEHHADVAAGLYRRLSKPGTVVVVTRPHDSSHYPFFDAAHRVWASQQAETQVYVDVFKAAGFDVVVHTHDFPVEMTWGKWIRMVQQRFWSTFSHLTDEELAAGVGELRTRFSSGDDTLRFPDKLVFIVAQVLA